jgi:hypothetical protein
MVDADIVLETILSVGFSLMGLGMIGYCIRRYTATHTLKKSQSTEELSSVSTEDPNV